MQSNTSSPFDSSFFDYFLISFYCFLLLIAVYCLRLKQPFFTPIITSHIHIQLFNCLRSLSNIISLSLFLSSL